MQADGLVVEIVKRFTKPLRQIKDITELKGSKRPCWSTTHVIFSPKGQSQSDLLTPNSHGGCGVRTRVTYSKEVYITGMHQALYTDQQVTQHAMFWGH